MIDSGGNLRTLIGHQQKTTADCYTLEVLTLLQLLPEPYRQGYKSKHLLIEKSFPENQHLYSRKKPTMPIDPPSYIACSDRSVLSEASELSCLRPSPPQPEPFLKMKPILSSYDDQHEFYEEDVELSSLVETSESSASSDKIFRPLSKNAHRPDPLPSRFEPPADTLLAEYSESNALDKENARLSRRTAQHLRESCENPKGMIRSSQPQRKESYSKNTIGTTSKTSQGDAHSPSQKNKRSPTTRSPTASLDWRMDPASSLSDWKLEIFNRSTRKFTTYHVHRVVLGVGPRSCGRFSFQETSGVTRVPLIAQACKLMPLFLDFLYGQTAFAITTDNALGLAHLATVFEQAKLTTWVREFVMQDLTSKKLLRYWWDATYYDQVFYMDLLLQRAALELREAPKEVVTSWLKEWSPTYILQLQRLCHQVPTHLESSQWSTIVAEYCDLHPRDMTLELLTQLTATLDTNMDPQAAMSLLEWELKLSGGESSLDRSFSFDEAQLEQSHLQSRCLKVLSDDWTSLESPSWKSMLNVLTRRNQKSNQLLIAWFPTLLQKAQDQLAKLQKTDLESKQRETKLRSDMKEIAFECQDANEDLTHLRKTFTSAKEEMKEQVQGWIRKYESLRSQMKEREEIWVRQEVYWRTEERRWAMEKQELLEQLSTMKESTQSRNSSTSRTAGSSSWTYTSDTSSGAAWFG